MSAPRRNIKSLAALFAFEAAGRLGSFTVAAKELGVTQAAVSKHVAQLEDDIGGRLFDRLHREVRLTAKGTELFEIATQSLNSLGDALSRLREASPDRPITIGASLSMSHFWLMPKLPAFRSSNGDMQIRVVSQDEYIPIDDQSADMAIRFGEGQWTDGRVVPLFKAQLYPMASPALLKSRPDLHRVEDILSLPMIDYDAPTPSWARWADWFEVAGIQPHKLKPTLSFSRYLDAIHAARADQGVVLVWGGLTGGIEERGDLVRLPGPALRAKGDYYLVVDKARTTPNVAKVVGWLTVEAHRQTLLMTADPD